jgi:hypothetical protein
MFKNLRCFFHCTRATAAVEAAIFAPIFAAMMLGVTDLGAGMFVRMQVNAATQAGAAYAVIHSCGTTCASSIAAAMNDAAGDPFFCSKATCTASIEECADGSPKCIIVTAADYPYTPILRDAVYSWASPQNYSSTITLRIE